MITVQGYRATIVQTDSTTSHEYCSGHGSIHEGCTRNVLSGGYLFDKDLWRQKSQRVRSRVLVYFALKYCDVFICIQRHHLDFRDSHSFPFYAIGNVYP